MDSLSNLRNSLDDADYTPLHPDGSDATRATNGSADIASIERNRRQKHLGDHEQELTKQFKAAALQLTTLYRSSLSSNTASYEAGYRHALNHVLELLVRPPTGAASSSSEHGDASGSSVQQLHQQPSSSSSSSSEASPLDNLTPEQGLHRLLWLTGYLQRRIEAMSTQDDDDDLPAATLPSQCAPQPQQQSSERSRPVRFEGAAPPPSLRQLHAASSSPLANANSPLPSPLASAVRFGGSNLGSSLNSPRPRSGFGTPVPTTTASGDGTVTPPSSSRPISAYGHPTASGRATETSTPSFTTRQASGGSRLVAPTATAPASTQSSSSHGTPGGTKRTRGGGEGGSVSSTPSTDITVFPTPHDLSPAAPRRRIGGRRLASGMTATPQSANFSSPSSAVGHHGGPSLGLLPTSALKSGSFDFKLPQSVGVRSVDFTSHGMTAVATAAKLNAAGKRQAGAGTQSSVAPGSVGGGGKRNGSHASGLLLRRNRCGRLRLTPGGGMGLRAGMTGTPSSTAADEHEMVTDSEDDWVDDEDEEESTTATSGGAVQSSARHGPSRGAGGRAKRRRTARGEGDGGDKNGDGAGDVEM